MGNAATAGEKMEEVKKKTDPVRVLDVAISRGERFVNAAPFTSCDLYKGPKIKSGA